MSAELAVVGGLGFISALFAYMAFSLRAKDDNDDTFGNKLSLFLFFCSVLFCNLLMYSLLLISQNSLPYLEAPVIGIGLSIMTYGTIGAVIIYTIYLISLFLKTVYDVVMQAMGKRGKSE